MLYYIYIGCLKVCRGWVVGRRSEISIQKGTFVLWSLGSYPNRFIFRVCPFLKIRAIRWQRVEF